MLVTIISKVGEFVQLQIWFVGYGSKKKKFHEIIIKFLHSK